MGITISHVGIKCARLGIKLNSTSYNNNNIIKEILSEYDQEISQPKTADKPVAS